MPAPAEPTIPPMSPEEFLAAVKKLKFARSHAANDLGLSAAARFFGASARTGQTWATEGPPAAVAIALRLMLTYDLDADSAVTVLGTPRRR